MSDSQYIERVAIVGASGNLGAHFLEELLKTKKQSITVLTRKGGNADFPSEVKVIGVDYDKHEDMVSALRGQQFLIITLAVTAPRDLQAKIIDAATEAGVKHIMPNIYGPDIFYSPYAKEAFPISDYKSTYEKINAKGASWTCLMCGFWYEWSVALGEPWFSIDTKNKTATLFDDGITKQNVSTWRQCGRAVAAFLSLPLEKGSGTGLSIADYKNKPLYIDSFSVSQRDMLDSVHRVLGDSDSDWKITHASSRERWEHGMEALKEGKHWAFVEVMYMRTFFPSGDGEYGKRETLANEALGLAKEDIDEATKRAVDMAAKDFYGDFKRGLLQGYS